MDGEFSKNLIEGGTVKNSSLEVYIYNELEFPRFCRLKYSRVRLKSSATYWSTKLSRLPNSSFKQNSNSETKLDFYFAKLRVRQAGFHFIEQQLLPKIKLITWKRWFQIGTKILLKLYYSLAHQPSQNTAYQTRVRLVT